MLAINVDAANVTCTTASVGYQGWQWSYSQCISQWLVL